MTNNQRLSKKFHPDINPDESAHEKFIEVSKGIVDVATRLTPAYEILSDTEVCNAITHSTRPNPRHETSMTEAVTPL